jgi:hypothetical protein
MEIKIETGDTISTSGTTLWGGTATNSSYIYFNFSGSWGWMVSSYPELMSKTNNQNWQTLKTNTLYDVSYTEAADMKSREITVNGESCILPIVSGYANARSDTSYYLGCRNKSGVCDLTNVYPFKMYKWTYYTRGGICMAKMTPARRKSDSVEGMYCAVRKTFYPLKPI